MVEEKDMEGRKTQVYVTVRIQNLRHLPYGQVVDPFKFKSAFVKMGKETRLERKYLRDLESCRVDVKHDFNEVEPLVLVALKLLSGNQQFEDFEDLLVEDQDFQALS